MNKTMLILYLNLTNEINFKFLIPTENPRDG